MLYSGIPGFMSPESWLPNLTVRILIPLISLQDLGPHAGVQVQEAEHVLAQLKQRLEVWAD